MSAGRRRSSSSPRCRRSCSSHCCACNCSRPATRLGVADGAAEAGALALAAGLPADDAISAALPEWARSGRRSEGGRAADRDGTAALAAGAPGAGAGGELIGLGASRAETVAEMTDVIFVSELEGADGALGLRRRAGLRARRVRSRAGAASSSSRRVANARAARRCSRPTRRAALEGELRAAGSQRGGAGARGVGHRR